MHTHTHQAHTVTRRPQPRARQARPGPADPRKKPRSDPPDRPRPAASERARERCASTSDQCRKNQICNGPVSRYEDMSHHAHSFIIALACAAASRLACVCDSLSLHRLPLVGWLSLPHTPRQPGRQQAQRCGDRPDHREMLARPACPPARRARPACPPGRCALPACPPGVSSRPECPPAPHARPVCPPAPCARRRALPNMGAL